MQSRRLRIESLETRWLLASLGLELRFLADNNGVPAATEISQPVLRGTPLWLDVRVQDTNRPANQVPAGIIALPLDVGWDRNRVSLFRTDIPATGIDVIALNDALVTDRFPLQRSVESFNGNAGPFGLTPQDLEADFNLRCVRGASLPNISQGSAIGVTQPETFSQLLFSTTSAGSTRFVVHLDGSLSFADAAILESVVPLNATVLEPSLENTVSRSLTIIDGSISGLKFNDLDGDGVRDTGEPGIPNIEIRLTPANTTIAPSTTKTAADGSYQFTNLTAGSYQVSEVVPTGSAITVPVTNQYNVTLDQGNQAATNRDFGNFSPVTLGGVKFIDSNNNQRRDMNEAGLGGVTMRLDINNDGMKSNDPATVTTNEVGEYRFANVPPGTHRITEIVPPGMIQTFPPTGEYVVNVVSGQNQLSLDFANQTVVSGETAGTKFDDLNGNGMRDSGEQGLAGITIALDLNRDGLVDQQTVTDASGSFLFNMVPAGSHAVREVVPPGTVSTSANPVLVTVDQNRVDGILFGNFQLTTFSGVVYTDTNRNGVRDNTGEPVRTGVIVELDLGNNGGADATSFTNDDGRYQFTNVPPGQHTVRLVDPNEITITQPVTGVPAYTIDNRSGQSRTDLDFGFNSIVAPPVGVSIRGSVYTDLNRNGQFDTAEYGIAGVNIELYNALSNALVQTTTTLLDGAYEFNGLAAGTYCIVEILPDRFRSVSIAAGMVLPTGESRGTTVGLNQFDAIVLSEGDLAIGYNFGEIVATASKRWVRSAMNPRTELAANAGLVVDSMLGTSGDDVFEVTHMAGSQISVRINSGSPIIRSATAAPLIIDTLDGNDQVMVTGNASDESFRLSPGKAVFTSQSGTVGIFGAEDIRVSGGGGNDRVMVEDSSASDQLTASGNTFTLESEYGQQVAVQDVSRIDALSPIDIAPDNENVDAIDFTLRLSGDWIRR